MDSLRDSLILNSIPLPYNVEDSASLSHRRSFTDFDMPATVSYSVDDAHHQRLHVNFPREDSSQGLRFPTQTYLSTKAYDQHPQPSVNLPNGSFFPFDIINYFG